MSRCLWAEHPLAEILTLAGGRTAEWEAIGAGPPLMWVEGGPGLWAHLARPDVELVSDLFRGHLDPAPGGQGSVMSRASSSRCSEVRWRRSRRADTVTSPP